MVSRRRRLTAKFAKSGRFTLVARRAAHHCYSEFHRVFRMWRNLMALKRAGRGHEPEGIVKTPNGGLMVECPACPHPGRNLPGGWEAAGALWQVYFLFLL